MTDSPSPEKLPADAGARERAVTVTDRNLVVVAGAGSGKTSLLVERIVYLLFTAEIAPSSFIALTFTRLAAAQMRARVWNAFLWFEALGEEANNNDLPGVKEAKRVLGRLLQLGWTVERVKELAAELLTKLDPGAISTIHGYCMQLISRYPSEAGVSPSVQLADEGDLDRFAAEIWPQVLLSDDHHPARDAELEYLLSKFDIEDLKTLFVDLLNSNRPVEAWLSTGISKAGADESLREALRGAPERLLKLASVVGKSKFGEMLQKGAAMAALAEREGIAAIRKQSAEGVSTGDSKKADPAEQAFANRILQILDLCRRVDEESMSRALLWLCVPAAAAREKRAREGWISNDGLLVCVRDLLKNAPSVRRAEGGRLQQILVDEFQDTDPLQYEILFYLSESGRGSAAESAWEAEPAAGKLFIVGDPKQSIYRFRGADMEAYSRAVEKIIKNGGETLELTVSFRSPAEILQPLDRLFSNWLDARDDTERRHRAAPEYIAIEPHRETAGAAFSKDDGSPRVEIWSPASVASDERRAEEAEWIAQDIAANITKTAKRADRESRLTPRHHAILLRSFSNVSLYARALEDRGIAVLLQGGRTFYERTEVTDLRSWLRAVAEPNDAIALLAACRSVAGAVPDLELQQFAASGAAWNSLYPAEAAKYPNIARVFSILSESREYASVRSPEDVIRDLLQKTKLYELHAAGFDGAQRIANLEKCIEIAATLARTRGLALDEVASELAFRARATGREGEQSLAEEGIDAVQILTIHGAKGLEFEIVYLADLARENRPVPVPSYVHNQEGAAAAAAKKSVMLTIAGARRELRERVHAAAEERRLFYVATTRAKERLIFVAGDARSPGFRGPWLNRLREAFLYDPSDEDGKLLIGGGAMHKKPPSNYTKEELASKESYHFTEGALAFIKNARSASAAARPPLVSPSGLAEARDWEQNGDEEDAIVYKSSGRETARAVGVAVHRILQFADFSNTTKPLASDGELADACDAAAAESAGDPARVRADVTKILVEFNKSALRRRLSKVNIRARELPLLAFENGVAIHGFADFIFEENGETVLGDWKTDVVDGAGSLDEAAKRHFAQLNFYRRALEQILGVSVRAELLFVRAGTSVVVPPVPKN